MDQAAVEKMLEEGSIAPNCALLLWKIEDCRKCISHSRRLINIVPNLPTLPGYQEVQEALRTLNEKCDEMSRMVAKIEEMVLASPPSEAIAKVFLEALTSIEVDMEALVHKLVIQDCDDALAEGAYGTDQPC